jgi:hypothetical protein
MSWIVRLDIVRGDAAAEVRGRVAGQGPPGELVRPGCGAAARGGEAVPHAQRLELHEGEPLLVAGVPMLCWPFFFEQQTNVWYKCVEWGVGMEVGDDVRREAVQERIRETMGGEKRKEMVRRAAGWKAANARSMPTN